MNQFPTPYIHFFAANLIFLISCIFCAYARWRHICPEFSDDLDWYYPARRPYITVFLVALLEFPYLFNVFSPDALLYARAFMAVTYPIFVIILIERYFFYTHFSTKYIIHITILPILLLLPLAYFALLGGDITSKYKFQIMSAAIALSVGEVLFGIKSGRKLYSNAKQKAETEYSSPEEFPIGIAMKVVYIEPILILVCVIIPSLLDSGWAKVARDLLLSTFSIWLTVTTLVSHRPLKQESREESEAEDCLSDFHESALIEAIVEITISKRLFLNPSLKLNELVTAVGSNRRYVSKAISDSKWKSFYWLINSLRIAYALEMKEDFPTMKQEDLATHSGFTSRFHLNRWMKNWESGELKEIDDNIRKLVYDADNNKKIPSE